MAEIKLKSAWVGDLPVPTSSVAWKSRRRRRVSPSGSPTKLRCANSSSVAKAQPVIEEAISGLAHGTAFPLQFDVDRRRFRVSNIVVGEGKLSVTLAPVVTIPGAMASSPLPPVARGNRGGPTLAYLMHQSEISGILAAAGLRPQHQFGQNFMVDQGALQAIADAGEIAPGDVVLEVGPGVEI